MRKRKKPLEATGLTPAWEMDAIQFPRLLAEIWAMAVTSAQQQHLCEEMDLNPDELDALFIRAQKRWDAMKSDTLNKHAPKRAPYAAVLDHHFSITERGNIWLVHQEENYHNAWIRLQGSLWLEIAIRPCNYPGLTVQLINRTDAELSAHIRQEFGGGLWCARKLEIDGVKTRADGTIIGKGDEEDTP